MLGSSHVCCRHGRWRDCRKQAVLQVLSNGCNLPQCADYCLFQTAKFQFTKLTQRHRNRTCLFPTAPPPVRCLTREPVAPAHRKESRCTARRWRPPTLSADHLASSAPLVRKHLVTIRPSILICTPSWRLTWPNPDCQWPSPWTHHDPRAALRLVGKRLALRVTMRRRDPGDQRPRREANLAR